MKKHKVVSILKTFDKATIKRFKQFVHSPYHLNSPKVLALAEYILHFAPDFDSEGLSDLQAYGVIFPGKKFVKQELIRYQSKLLVIVEEFLITENLKKDERQKLYYLQQYYFNHQLEAGFNKSYRLLAKETQKSSVKDSSDFFYSYLNSKTAFGFFNLKEMLKKLLRA
jgi:hypothetical protein